MSSSFENWSTASEGGTDGQNKAVMISPNKSVLDAYKRVKANKGAAGIDEESIEKLSKRISKTISTRSGIACPREAISRRQSKQWKYQRKTGEIRMLGVPTVADRIAQMVAKIYFEPTVEPYFHPDSYGYRPGKSAIDAVAVTRERCWQYDWVLEFDIKGLFDNIDHELLMKAVRKHTDCKWVILYIERWLKAPFQMEDGRIMRAQCGNSARRGYQSRSCESVSALCV